MDPTQADRHILRQNLASASTLAPEYHIKLEALENQMGDDIRQDPGMDEVYAILSRQHMVPECWAMTLYPRLEKRRQKAEEEEAEKAAEAEPAPPTPPPHIVPAAPPALQQAPPPPLDPPAPPSSAPTTPMGPPPSLPPQLTRGEKREQDPGELPTAKKTKSSYIRCVGDWSCGKCGF
jgi:hypothetical protein